MYNRKLITIVGLVLAALLSTLFGAGPAAAGGSGVDNTAQSAQVYQRPELTVIGDSIALAYGGRIKLNGVEVVNTAISGTCLGKRPGDPFCLHGSNSTLMKRLRHLDPDSHDLVLVSIGTNDLPYAKARPMIDDYKRAIRYLDRSGARYWFATITPFRPGDEWRAGFNPVRVKINEWLMAHVPVIDAAKAVGGDYMKARYNLDGLHMNPLGSQRIADTVERAIESALTRS